MRELDRVAERDFWPGFRPESIAVALYDGERTWLFRHPAPPDGYEPVADEPGVVARSGRDSLVWANSSVVMNGVTTATVMPPVAGASALNVAALTEAADAHPLFSGVRRVTVTGVAADPVVTEADGTVCGSRRTACVASSAG